MKKLLSIVAMVVCLLSCSAISFSREKPPGKPPLPDGAYSRWIIEIHTFEGPYRKYAEAAKAEGSDVLIDDGAAGCGYSSSKLLVYFDKRTTNPILVSMDNKKTEVMVFKDRSQYEDYVPTNIRKKIKQLCSWKDWK